MKPFLHVFGEPDLKWFLEDLSFEYERCVCQFATLFFSKKKTCPLNSICWWIIWLSLYCPNSSLLSPYFTQQSARVNFENVSTEYVRDGRYGWYGSGGNGWKHLKSWCISWNIHLQMDDDWGCVLISGNLQAWCFSAANFVGFFGLKQCPKRTRTDLSHIKSHE